jgi:putative adhesin
MPGTRSLVAFTLLSIAVTIPGFASHGHHGLNVSIEDDLPVTSCDQLHVRSDDQQVARAEDRLTLPQSSSTVRVNAAQNGGIYVYGSDRTDFAVLNCKFAMSSDGSAAESKLQQINMSFESGALAVKGPDDGDWTSYLVIQAPRSSSLSLSGINGPIAFSGMTGKMEVQNTNGPLSIKNSSGEIKAEITNGPISYAGNGGDVRLRAENGPIAVKLNGTSWNGKGLEAESTNGPLALKLPDNYTSGVLVQTRGYSPFHCSRCDSARKDFDEDNKSVQFGNGSPVVVHLSTVNGPVSINENDD